MSLVSIREFKALSYYVVWPDNFGRAKELKTIFGNSRVRISLQSAQEPNFDLVIISH
jgi:hypothetical protein